MDMRHATIALAFALAPALARGQTSATHDSAAHAAHHAARPTGERMKTPCPLHLTTLDLTPAQDFAFKAIRKAHRAEMTHDSATHAQHMARMKQEAATPDMMQVAQDSMKASMTRALDAARTVLSAPQREKFDAAVKAHDAEKAERKAKGLPPCAGCCEHGEHAKHE
jgi:hypothetical protein